MPRLSALIVFFLAHILVAKGQNPAVYNINKYNGLSTNHVYGSLVDHLGYLWIYTIDGVYRYNGYTLTRYDYNNGLPNTDVWNMYEDRNGRIWLRSIAKGIGYIKNNRYYPAVVKHDSTYETIYPSEFIELESSIIFLTRNPAPNTHSWGIIKGDTVEIQNDSTDYNVMYITQDIMAVANNQLMHFYPIDALDKRNRSKYSPEIKKSPIKHLGYLSSHNISSTINNIKNFSNPGIDSIIFFDFEKNNAKIVFTRSGNGEFIVHVAAYHNMMYALTNQNIYTITMDGTITDTISYRSLFPYASVGNFNATFYMPDKLWGKCLSTNNQGLFINFPVPDAPKDHDIQLANYKYISGQNDSAGFWWNTSQNNICHISDGIVKNTISIKDWHTIQKIVSYSPEKALMMTTNALYWLHNDGSMVNFLSGIDSLIGMESPPESFLSTFSTVNDVIVIDSINFIFQGSGYVGTAHVTTDYKAKKVYVNVIDPERCRGSFFYPALNCYILYSSDKIILYNIHTKTKSVLSPKLLKALKVQRIEYISSDQYGNLIIKDYDRLLIFNPKSGRFSTLLDNYNFQNSFLSVRGNTLSVAGIFGVLQCNTTAFGQVTNIRTYPNTKTLFYRYIYDVQFSPQNILLKTDNGAFMVWPSDSTGLTENENYHFILDIAGNLCNIHAGDTFQISQNTTALGTDVIKPTGSGNLSIRYAVNDYSYVNTGYQLILPTLKPGSYNTVSIIASDDSWRSKALTFIIYVKPYWWQTQTARRITFVFVLLAFIGFVYLVIVTTRRIVNRNNERKNQRRELELKSIYSQINPHFIFNSLSTAQYFVKKNKNKEAFEHINQFSDLLRAYIKSSRAKYITIAEEIDNLENYLQLQLTRFEEKFDYNITIDTSVNPQKVKIPSLLLQPLVENALNHGIFHSETKGNLHVSFKVDEQDKDTLVCMVDDNGVGRQRSKELRGKIIRKADSYGTILIKELIDTFNKYEKINIEIEYVDKRPPQSGTTVTVRIKNYAQIP